MMRLCTQAIQNDEVMYSNYTKWWGCVLKLYKMMRLRTQAIQNDEVMYSNYTKWWDYVLKL